MLEAAATPARSPRAAAGERRPPRTPTSMAAVAAARNRLSTAARAARSSTPPGGPGVTGSGTLPTITPDPWGAVGAATVITAAGPAGTLASAGQGLRAAPGDVTMESSSRSRWMSGSMDVRAG